MRVRLLGQRRDRRLGARGDVLEALHLFLLVIDEVGGVDAHGLVGDHRAQRAEGLADLVGGLEVAGVVVAPGLFQPRGDLRGVRRLAQLRIALEQRGDPRGVGERLLVAGMQLRPRLVQLVARILERLAGVRKRRPLALGHRRLLAVAVR